MSDGSDLPAVNFKIETPLNADLIAGQIASANARGLPDFDADDGPHIHIIANGPSARQAPFGAFDGPTVALNGAMQLFVQNGLAPTYWAACDPQGLVTNFLTGAPKETVYLLASKCHPSVFDFLRHRDVRLWHIDDHPCGAHPVVPSAVSVTLTVMSLFARKGYRRFELWGWDGCYVDGKDHATRQAHITNNDVTVEIGDRFFKSTGSWGAEAADVDRQLTVFEWMGLKVNIHGDGMFRALRDFRIKQNARP